MKSIDNFAAFTAQISIFPKNSTVLLGENGTFHCTAVNADTLIWRLKPATGFEDEIRLLDTSRTVEDESYLKTLAADGIFIYGKQNNDSYVSLLTINGSSEHNFTRVQCTTSKPDLNKLSFNDTMVSYIRVLGKFR